MNIRKKMFVGIICILVCILLGELNAAAYTDTDLYNEKLEFDSKGNLLMTTHDKKATSRIIYKTIGWVIKRYDMPKDAGGQQYAIIPIGNNVTYRDDPKDSAYVYCYYTVNRDTISEAIGSVSAEWKNQLYKYGDYVYVDEIMTIVENGNICGGINGTNGSFWGEVYFTYAGISEARQWASKENLKTHYDKTIYFPSQVQPKYFSKKEKTTLQQSNSNSPKSEMDIGEGTRFNSTYDITKAVPTGSGLYMYGTAEQYIYSLTFNKITTTFRIPIKFVVTYTLNWKDYSGVLKSEKKEIVQWYYVTRSVSYYLINDCQVRYLTGVHADNYAFDNCDINFNVETVHMSKKQNMEYESHVDFKVYKDVYYLDGGTITQTAVNGVKPNIPEVNRQSLADSKIETIRVKNDYLKFNDIVISDNTWVNSNAPIPYMGNLSKRYIVYTTGRIIPHSRQNSQNQTTSCYYIYKEYNSEKISRENVYNMKKISIHTPVYIEGQIIPDGSSNKMNAENTDANVIYSGEAFDVVPITKGSHIEAEGYGIRDYGYTTEMVEIKFNCNINIEKNDGTISEIEAGTWLRFDEKDKYALADGTEEGDYIMDIRAYAKNYKSIVNPLEHMEVMANTDYNNYVAVNSVDFTIVKRKNESETKYIVVGTH